MDSLNKYFSILIIFALSCIYLHASANYPKRIVSLTPSGTEILFAIGCGDRIVARTDFCNFPEETKSIPSVGGFDGKSLSIESLLSHDPDFVYMTSGMHDHLIPLLKQFKIKYYLSSAKTVDDILVEINEIGKITGNSRQAYHLVKVLKDQLAELTGTKNASGQKVYCEFFYSPYISCGSESYINDILKICGAENIFSDIKSNYPQVSEEMILSRNPDLIIVPDYSQEDLEAIYKRKAWNNISAVKNKRVYAVSGDIFSRPGPRFLDAIKLVQELLIEE
ncbi:MAG: cobalamin-binding protein [Treponemataceae bacterium]|nr:cobalamin-binding protein [Treponemataceae bacterium]